MTTATVPRHDAPRVMMSCGEASGDLYAGAVARELHRLAPGVEIAGFGGPRLEAAGARLLGNYRHFAVTGFFEAASVLPRAFRMLRTLREEARAWRPDVFVAVDFPDFNFRLLEPLHALGVPIVYYISPQLWAWRPGRIEQIRRYVTTMLVIFPFEVDVYRSAGVPVEFVGHPLVELIAPTRPREAWLAERALDPSRPVLALLPGSRPNEIHRLLPAMLAALPLVAARAPGLQVLLARAPSLSDHLFDAVRASAVPVTVVDQATDDVLAASDVVVTASGTATVQTAIHGKPMVIVYRLSSVDYALGRLFVKVTNYGMANLIAGRTIVPELIQDACTPERIAAEVVPLLTDRTHAAKVRSDLDVVRARLGGPGASARAASAILAAARGPVVR